VEGSPGGGLLGEESACLHRSVGLDDPGKALKADPTILFRVEEIEDIPPSLDGNVQTEREQGGLKLGVLQALITVS